MRRSVPIAPLVLATAACALAVAGCGGGRTRQLPTTAKQPHKARVHRPVTLQIVVSLPLTGPAAPQGQAAYDGARLALIDAHGRAGDYPIKLVSRDDAGRHSVWDAATVADNALTAVASASTILYIGELASGATEVSSPIVSGAGIPQISPGSPATDFGAPPSSTQGARPAPASTLLRLAPSNRSQAGAILSAAAHVTGCTRLVLLHGSDLDATDLAAWITRLAPTSGINKVLSPSMATAHGKAPSLSAYLASLARLGANCGAYAGDLAGDATALVVQLHAALLVPRAIVASSGVCTRAWVQPAQGGEPAVIDPSLKCAAPGPRLTATKQGRAFLRSYEAVYHADPDPLAAYGYEAMELGLEAISGLGRDGDSRSLVLDALRDVSEVDTPIGSFWFASGQTTSSTYTIYHVGPGGTLAPAP